MKLLRLFCKAGREAGQSAVEVALVLPVLTVLALGTYDFSCALRTKNTLINLSREGASLAMRSLRTSNDFQKVMSTLAAAVGPLQLEKDGMMYVTEISVRNGVRTVTRIPWDRNPAAPCGDVVAEFPPSPLAGTVPVAEGTSVCIFEVVYKYDSLLLPAYAHQLRSTTVF
jgi:Flp pilus assembly protein TadG